MFVYCAVRATITDQSYNKMIEWLAIWCLKIGTFVLIKVLLTYLYSAFANSCPLQTDTFLFPLIHRHNVTPSSNKF